MIELRHLKAFVTVAEEAHFGRAAERLGQSQPGLSRSVKALEQSVGAPLLERTTRRVSLTPAGNAFLPRVRSLLADLDEALGDARRAAQGFEGRIVISSMDFAVLGRLPEIVAGFRQRHPEVEVDLRYAWTERQRAELIAGEVDVGFLIGPFTAPGIRARTVDQQQFVAVLPETHPLAANGSLRVRELADEAFVFGVQEEWSPVRTAIDRLCHAAGFSPRVVQEAHSRDGIFGFVAAGLGVTLDTEAALVGSRRGVAVVPIADAHEPIDVVAAWRAVSQPPVLRRFVGYLEAFLEGA